MRDSQTGGTRERVTLVTGTLTGDNTHLFRLGTVLGGSIGALKRQERDRLTGVTEVATKIMNAKTVNRETRATKQCIT